MRVTKTAVLSGYPQDVFIRAQQGFQSAGPTGGGAMRQATEGVSNRRWQEGASCTPQCLDTIHDCLTCSKREDHLFCNLSVHAGERLNDIKSTAVHRKGATLFTEGQQPIGVFVLCSGTAKLTTSSREGKTIITKLSESGDVLGLNAVISNRTYEVTAEMMEPGQANFIARDSLLQLLKDHGEVVLRVGEQLSSGSTAHEEIRTLGLSASERLAKFLLPCSTKTNQNHGPGR